MQNSDIFKVIKIVVELVYLRSNFGNERLIFWIRREGENKGGKDRGVS